MYIHVSVIKSNDFNEDDTIYSIFHWDYLFNYTTFSDVINFAVYPIDLQVFFNNFLKQEYLR